MAAFRNPDFQVVPKLRPDVCHWHITTQLKTSDVSLFSVFIWLQIMRIFLYKPNQQILLFLRKKTQEQFNPKLETVVNIVFHMAISSSIEGSWKVLGEFLLYCCSLQFCFKSIIYIIIISNLYCNCSSQPSMVHWLSSSIFPCLVVPLW